MNALDWLKKNYDDIDWSNLQEDLMDSIIEYMEDYAVYRQNKREDAYISDSPRQCDHTYEDDITMGKEVMVCSKCGDML